MDVIKFHGKAESAKKFDVHLPPLVDNNLDLPDQVRLSACWIELTVPHCPIEGVKNAEIMCHFWPFGWISR